MLWVLFSPNVYIDEAIGGLVEWATVDSGLTPWLCTSFSYEVLNLCGRSLEFRIRISSAEVQKVMGVQFLKVGSRQGGA